MKKTLFAIITFLASAAFTLSLVYLWLPRRQYSAPRAKSWQAYPFTNGEINFPEDEGLHQESNLESWSANFKLKTDISWYSGFLTLFKLGKQANGLLLLSLTDIDSGANVQKFAEGEITYDPENFQLEFRGKDSQDQIKLTGNWLGPLTYQLACNSPLATFELMLNNQKPPLTVNRNKFVPLFIKEMAINAHYYAFSRQEASGSLSIGGQSHLIHTVTGTSWLDHQWLNLSDQELANFNFVSSPNEWFWLQFDNHTEAVFGQTFNQDGSVADKYFSFVDETGNQFETAEFNLEPLAQWTAPSGKRVTVAYKLTVAEPDLKIILQPTVENQLFSSPRGEFWQGAIAGTGSLQGTDHSLNFGVARIIGNH
ncbi:MAG TPA: lipocalin family protein [Candidatus Bathyarchaeia archaeon]|nr:lipocalin family protein [Candidatus Bathyarchaeia archaeon]